MMNSLATDRAATTTNIETRLLHAIRQIGALLERINCKPNPGLQRPFEEDTITVLGRILESLPLSTAEYGVAANRLENAGRYMRSEENGAASYELRMLARSLGRNLSRNEKGGTHTERVFETLS